MAEIAVEVLEVGVVAGGRGGEEAPGSRRCE